MVSLYTHIYFTTILRDTNDYIHVNPTLQKRTKKSLSRAGFELASAWKHIHTLDDYIDVRVIAQNPTIYNMYKLYVYNNMSACENHEIC